MQFHLIQAKKLEITPFIVAPTPCCPCLTWACFPGSLWSGTTRRSSSREKHVLPSWQRRLKPVPHTRPVWPWRTMTALRRRNTLLWCEGRGRLTHLAGESKNTQKLRIILPMHGSVRECVACNYVIADCVNNQHVSIKFHSFLMLVIGSRCALQYKLLWNGGAQHHTAAFTYHIWALVYTVKLIQRIHH